MRPRYDLHARDKVLTLGHETRIMGVINCTPDSFSRDGKLKSPRGKINTAACLRHAHHLVAQGADVLDIGGESTRPGAIEVSLQEEIRRVIPVIEVLARNVNVPISVDTSKMEVARRALDAGASIVNNIMATRASGGFLKMVRDHKAAIIIMHMRGRPSTMQAHTKYKDVVSEVIEELQISVEKCLGVGIKKESIIVDPGIGFAKTVEQNLTLIDHLDRLNVLHCPILLGASRKSFIGQVLDKPVTQRLMGTAATMVAGAIRGAHMVRAHDVKEIKETLKMTDAILNS